MIISQCAAQHLLSLDGFEQTLEVSCTETTEVGPVDYLNEYSRSVHQVLGEQLQQIAALVEVDENTQLPQLIEILGYLDRGIRKALLHELVVRVRDLDELNATLAKVRNVANDVVCPQRNVLDSSTIIKINILFDLRLLKAFGGLVDWHLDLLIR